MQTAQTKTPETTTVARQTAVGIAIAIGSAAIFGIWPAATRGLYADGASTSFALLTSVWARALAMLAFCLITRRPLFTEPAHRRQAVSGGLFQALAVTCIFAALVYLPGPVALIISYTHTLLLLLFLAWRGEVKLTRTILITTISAFAGLLLVLNIGQQQPAATIIGYVLAFGAALGTLSRLYVFGKLTQTRHPIVVGAESFLIAAPVVSLTALVSPIILPQSMLGYVYTMLGCGTITLGFFGMFYGIKRLGAFRWSLFSKLEPVFTAIFAALLIGETLSPLQYLGMAIVLGSLVCYQVMETRRKN